MQEGVEEEVAASPTLFWAVVQLTNRKFGAEQEAERRPISSLSPVERFSLKCNFIGSRSALRVQHSRRKSLRVALVFTVSGSLLVYFLRLRITKTFSLPL